jgi:hypothetical protein
MWNVKAKVTPVILGATKTISRLPKKYLSNITGKQKSRNYKKNHIQRCTHTAESADVKVQNILTCEIILHVAQIVNREQLQHSVP